MRAVMHVASTYIDAQEVAYGRGNILFPLLPTVTCRMAHEVRILYWSRVMLFLSTQVI